MTDTAPLFPHEDAERLLELALAEDVGSGDVTTKSLALGGASAEGWMLCKEPGVLAGVPIADAVFRRLDSNAEVDWKAKDGDAIEEGDEILVVKANIGALLAGERTALNFLQRLSGIATTTREYAKRIAGTRASVLDTRKTTPGWRMLEKYAVAIGGGENHRIGLFDQALFKENHLELARRADESLAEVVSRARAATNRPVEVEVRDLAEAKQAHEAGADILMLDNMSVDDMREAVAHFSSLPADRRPLLEASGGITLETIRDVAETGVDRISCGALTHSPRALDLAMYIRG